GGGGGGVRSRVDAFVAGNPTLTLP
ncbi:hypothetical protein VCNHCC004A_000229B, partial [Vibrio cholerae O1 str. NHCC-004A]